MALRRTSRDLAASIVRRQRPATFGDYAASMGWERTARGWTGRVGTRAIEAYDEDGAGVLLMASPGSLTTIYCTRVERPLDLPLPRPGLLGGWTLERPDPDLIDLGGDLAPVRTGDPYFDRMYRVVAEVPWFASVVLSASARDALLAAPDQDWISCGTQLVSVGDQHDEPLATMARASALSEVLESVPWEAYAAPGAPPGRVRVVAALEARQERIRAHEEDVLSRLD